MPPEVKQMLLDHFQLVATFGTLVTWLAFRNSTFAPLKWGRRLALLLFLYFLYTFFKQYTPVVIAKIDIVDADVFIRRTFAMTKGTDWVEGFFWGISATIFVGIILAFVGLELMKKK